MLITYSEVTKNSDTASQPLAERTVLCVDDDSHILSSLRRLLRGEPYNVITTSDTSQALDYVEKYSINLAIVDQRMPQVTGSELAKEIKLRSPKTSVVILTGYPNDVPIVKSIMLDEINQLIFKPWSDKELKKTISELLRQQE